MLWGKDCLIGAEGVIDYVGGSTTGVLMSDLGNVSSYLHAVIVRQEGAEWKNTSNRTEGREKGLVGAHDRGAITDSKEQ